MPNDALTHFSPRVTPQTERAREDQIVNAAGGYVFEVDDFIRALRFLTLGVDGGTYYVSEPEHTRENAGFICGLADRDGEKLVQLIREVSLAGRAPRQNPTLFALAACFASKDLATRRAAARALPEVCRTGTHLFIFARYVEQFRGWGRLLKRAVAEWYTEKPTEAAAYQLVKYRQREGWSHRDVIRLAHPRPKSYEQGQLYRWTQYPEDAPAARLVEGFERAQAATAPKEWARLVDEYRLPWEALPDAAMNEPAVWEALLPHTGITALIRQLPRLTRLGLVGPMWAGHTKDIALRLATADELRKGRVHPLALLMAQATYGQGRGFRGDGAWVPVPEITAALEDGFYASFGAVQAAGKRTLIGLDVSGSMTAQIAKAPMSCVDTEAALALVTLRTEPFVYALPFATEAIPTNLTAHMSLSEIRRVLRGLGGGTDCSAPITWASRNKVLVDTFVIMTDNETWAGSIHPFQALKRYRTITGTPARLVVVAMTATRSSIGDQTDPDVLDVVGLDTSVPEVVNSFSRREL